MKTSEQIYVPGKRETLNRDPDYLKAIDGKKIEVLSHDKQRTLWEHEFVSDEAAEDYWEKLTPGVFQSWPEGEAPLPTQDHDGFDPLPG